MKPVSNIVPFKTDGASYESEKKFGKAVMSHGAYIVPALLFRAQARLGVNSTQMVVLLQLLDFWWSKGSSAHPSIKTIAERIDLTPKQVQRTVNALVEKKLITRINQHLPSGGKTSNLYKFDGLLKRLQAIEVDFDQARKAKKAAAKPGGLKANKQ